MKHSCVGLILAVCPLLAACGGGTDTAGSGAVVALPTFSGLGGGVPEVSDILDLGDALTDLSDAVTSGSITPGIPSVPTATYQGQVVTAFASGTSVVGNAELTADFVNNTLSGSTADFVIFVAPSLGGGTVTPTGNLPITNGTIDPNTAAIASDMNGTLTAGLGTYQITSQIDGFLVNNGTQNDMYGTVSGTVIDPGSTTSSISSGALIATSR